MRILSGSIFVKHSSIDRATFAELADYSSRAGSTTIREAAMATRNIASRLCIGAAFSVLALVSITTTLFAAETGMSGGGVNPGVRMRSDGGDGSGSGPGSGSGDGSGTMMGAATFNPAIRTDPAVRTNPGGTQFNPAVKQQQR
jgi:hypothetical protein